jgi:tRNA A-37 threonylcarbamoyl transferase component Bud32/Flp pilus assembly protein TadD
MPTFILIFFTLVAFFPSTAAQSQNDLKRAQEFYEKALKEKKTAARVELLQKAAQWCEAGHGAALSPISQRQMATIYFALGREFFQQAKWQAAIGHLEKVLAVDSAFFSAHGTLGLIYFQQKKYEAAIAAYDKALSAQPAAQLYNNLGAAYEAKGDLSAAVDAYCRALEMEAGLVPAQKNLQRVQGKLTLAGAVSPVAAKTAAVDSTRSAAPRRDSLIAVAPAFAVSSPTPNSTKEKIAKSKAPETKAPSSVEKSQQEKNSKKNQAISATRKLETASASAFPAATLKKDSVSSDRRLAAARVVADADSTRKNHDQSANIAAPIPAPRPPASSTTSSASGNSAFAYICGAGVILFGVFIFTQRRHLSRLWLQFRPAFATGAVTVREERLIPAAVARHSVNPQKDEAALKLMPKPAPVGEKPAEAEKDKSAPVTMPEGFESHEPSLQTQAFFAEMIAGEPEIDEFDGGATNETPSPKPPNGHLDSSAAESSTRSEPSEAVLGEEVSLVSTPIIVPIFALNGNNGQAVLAPPQVETPIAVTASESLVAANATRALVEASPRAVEILFPRDNEPSVVSHQEPATPASCEQSVLGRYVIEKEIGKGAMGKIYLASDPKLDRKVVIKTVCFNLASGETDAATLKDRVYREARAIAKLGHPNIVVVYDVEDDKELSYIVMEHIEGRDLRQALKSERRFEPDRALKIIAQVCSALDYAHAAGIIHRDIKPSNIMLLPNDKAKVTDFGIAKIADNFSLTLPGHVLGTPSYMAPEQFEGETIDGRADIFSLGVVLYELLTGCRPFAGDSLASLAYKIVHKMHLPPSLQNVELPLELDEIVGRALAKQPEERYQTAREFREALLAANFAVPA